MLLDLTCALPPLLFYFILNAVGNITVMFSSDHVIVNSCGNEDGLIKKEINKGTMKRVRDEYTLIYLLKYLIPWS